MITRKLIVPKFLRNIFGEGQFENNKSVFLIALFSLITGAFLLVVCIIWIIMEVICSSDTFTIEKAYHFGGIVGGGVGTFWVLASVFIYYMALNEQKKYNQKIEITSALTIFQTNFYKKFELFQKQKSSLEDTGTQTGIRNLIESHAQQFISKYDHLLEHLFPSENEISYKNVPDFLHEYSKLYGYSVLIFTIYTDFMYESKKPLYKNQKDSLDSILSLKNLLHYSISDNDLVLMFTYLVKLDKNHVHILVLIDNPVLIERVKHIFNKNLQLHIQTLIGVEILSKQPPPTEFELR
ncbi:MAG: hypothetical protein Q7J34_14175 [Bacteroidales bacterium]|jgi:hypothetical protein|nr:hypothetical protein [Bacteroidales bacterium]